MRTLLLVTLFASLTHAATMYTVVDLGSFGGSNSTAYRINGAGSVVGWSTNPLNDNHAFSTVSANALHDLNLSGASSSYAYDINGSGQVVGTSYIGGQAHGTIWTSSGTTDLGKDTFGLAINSSGEVAGGNGHAFIFSNGTFQDLGTLAGGNWSSAYGVNDDGMVTGYGMVGDGTFRAFTWTSDSGITMLGTLGGNSSYATAINNQGQIAGHSTAANGYEHAFVSIHGTLTDIGTLGGTSSYAYGINDAGVVVGYSGSDAFVYHNGSLDSLNAMIAANAGWQLQQAYGINDAGQIVGTGIYQGQSHSFRLDPVGPAAVPEPGSVVLIGIGLSLLAVRRFRRR